MKNKWVIEIYIKGILSMHTTDVIGNEVAFMTNTLTCTLVYIWMEKESFRYIEL
ncbi:hypothetical protein [Clostridium subterminale]|uniref:hypothetical protein n=1 Tax=Clostridium subterminale TaxID=1550 RepID=UPI0031D775C7